MKDWELKPLNSQSVYELSQRYGISVLEASIFYRRNFNEDDLRFFFKNDEIFLHNPFLFSDMEKVLQRLEEAVEEGEIIGIFGDKDADGVTSTALMSRFIESLGLRYHSRVPLGEEEYGLGFHNLEEFSEKNVSLLFTVDCGISNHAAIEKAQEYGIDVIIIDHHDPPEELPQAYGIINPKLKESTYPFRHLSACGVVSKVLWAHAFSQTPLYGKSLLLLDLVKKENKTYELKGLACENFLIEEEWSITLDHPSEALYQFQEKALGRHLYTFNSSLLKQELREILGPHFVLEVDDLHRPLLKFFPNLKGETLEELFVQHNPYFYDNRPLVFALKLLKALVRRQARSHFLLFQNNLDLVALSTIADIMPLRNENRILALKGLECLSKRQNPALNQLLQEKGKKILQEKITVRDASFLLIPTLNAAGRLGQADKALSFLQSKTLQEAKSRYEVLMELNKERRQLENKLHKEIKENIPQALQRFHQKFIILESPQAPRGLTGILAARISYQYHLPSFVITHNVTPSKGSMRAPAGFDGRAFLENFKDLLIDYGGHHNVGGFSILRENLKIFYQRAQKFSKGALLLHREKLFLDAFLPHSYLTPEIYQIAERFEPYGKDNHQLLFKSQNVLLERILPLGQGAETKNHRLKLAIGSYRWDAIIWNSLDLLKKLQLKDQMLIDIVFSPEVSYFRGQKQFRLIIEDIEISQTESLS